MESEDVMDAAELAKLLRITPSALRNKIWRKADHPPYIQLEGQKGKLWLRETVYKWLKQHETR